MKLGCLNHALLTVSEIERSGLTLVGWVANCIDPDMAYQQENIQLPATKVASTLPGNFALSVGTTDQYFSGQQL